jgi:hypothetical protein
VLGEAVLGAERLPDRLENERRISKRCQTDPEHPVLEAGHKLGGSLDREPRLAGPSGAGQGHEASVLAKHRGDLRLLPLPSHERARRPRQVGVGDRLGGRE